MARKAITAGQILRKRLLEDTKQHAKEAGFTFNWEPDELLVIDRVCDVADQIEALEKLLAVEGLSVTGAAGQAKLNPVVGELRLQRALLTTMLGRLRWPDLSDGSVKNFVKQKAAQARWGA